MLVMFVGISFVSKCTAQLSVPYWFGEKSVKSES